MISGPKAALVCMALGGVWGCNGSGQPRLDGSASTKSTARADGARGGVDGGSISDQAFEREPVADARGDAPRDGFGDGLGDGLGDGFGDVVIDPPYGDARRPALDHGSVVDISLDGTADLPNPASCATAPQVLLSGGRAVIVGSTQGSANEFPTLNCLVGTPFPELPRGPQATYSISGKKGQWYKLTLEASFDGLLYLFTSSGCDEGAIQRDCSSEGKSGVSSNLIPRNRPEAIYYQAATDGRIWLVVDSADSRQAGAFSLTVEEFYPAKNGSCDQATGLVFYKGVARARGDIHSGFTPDEFPDVHCGSAARPYGGPQVYFQFKGVKDQAYVITGVSESADTQYPLFMYLFGGTCDAAAIMGDCSSGGATGAVVEASLGLKGEQSMVFIAPVDGRYTIALDSRDPRARGGVEVRVESFDRGRNHQCVRAREVAFSQGELKITGFTAGLPDEFPLKITCGSSGAQEAGQLYYRVQLDGGVDYALEFSADFAATVYLFPQDAGCDPQKINDGCVQLGGLLHGRIGQVNRWTITPPNSGAYVLAVDGRLKTLHEGQFELHIRP